ncbi:DNA repair protein SWI5 homolog [Musca autumnalis]|uniref:DNA repair protein SWI5 homolog n=1 Tax=Musca autumnalis TaxID=221902 RepID=UPI003CED1355
MESTTTAQLKTIYEDLQQKLRQQATSASSIDQERKTEIMNLLHDFNDVKDAAQIVVGALANLERKTIKEMHLKYNLPLNE